MKKCVLLTNDPRTASQIRGWFKMFDSEPYLDAFLKISDFEDIYCTEAKTTDDVKQDSVKKTEATSINFDDEQGDELSQKRQLELAARLAPVSVLMIDLEMLPAPRIEWIKNTVKKLRANKHISDESQTRILLLGYDDPVLGPEKFRDELFDDMVLKPLDQQLFLQKIEFLLSPKPDITPSFLFRTKANDTIEIGKDSLIEEVAEFAISIRNPAPIAEGTYAILHSAVLGTKAASTRIIARAYTSVKHPRHQGAWLVRFTLFGITSEQLISLRRFIRSLHPPGRMPQQNRPTIARSSGESLPPKFRLGVIDLNPDVIDQVQSCVGENYERAATLNFSSYTRFLAELAKIQSRKSASDNPADANGIIDLDDTSQDTQEEAIPKGQTTLVVTAGTYELLDFLPALSRDDLFLGKPASEWITHGQDWFFSVPKEDLEDFNEFLVYTESGGLGVTGIRLKDQDSKIVYAEVKGRFIASDNPEKPSVIHLALKQIDRSSWIAVNRLVARGQTPEQYRLEALFIDGSLIRTDVAEWLEGLHTSFVKAQVIKDSEPLPKIFILADQRSTVDPANFTHRGVVDFIYKPIDRKVVIEKLGIALPQLTRSILPDSSPFTPCQVEVQICKTVQLDELSEFGLTILNKSPLRPKLYMRFFSSLFGDTSTGIIGRCTASIEVPGDEPLYKCLFVFFGCSDELHKRIRNWIRRDYVQKKEQ